MGLPASATAVRLGGLVAMAISVGAVVWVSRPFALAVSVSYLLLAAFVLAALLRHSPLQSCGCFGRDDTPPTIGHLVLNGAGALIAGVVALAPGQRGWGSVHLDTNPVAAALFVILTVSATALAYLALTEVPRLVASGDRARRRLT